MSNSICCLPVPSIPSVTDYLQFFRRAPCNLWSYRSNSCGDAILKGVLLTVAVVASIFAHIALILIAVVALPFRCCCLKSNARGSRSAAASGGAVADDDVGEGDLALRRISKTGRTRVSAALRELRAVNRTMVTEVMSQCIPQKEAYTVFLAMKSEITSNGTSASSNGIMSINVSPRGWCDISLIDGGTNIQTQLGLDPSSLDTGLELIIKNLPTNTRSRKLLEYLILYPNSASEGSYNVTIYKYEEARSRRDYSGERSIFPSEGIAESDLQKFLTTHDYAYIMPEFTRATEELAKLRTDPAPATAAQPAGGLDNEVDSGEDSEDGTEQIGALEVEGNDASGDDSGDDNGETPAVSLQQGR